MLIKLFLEMYHFCRYIFFCSYRPGATDMQLILAQDITQWILASVARIYMVKESGSQQVFFFLYISLTYGINTRAFVKHKSQYNAMDS